MSDADTARARVRSALERCLEQGEIGIQVAVLHGEELVVDESVGVVEEGSDRPVDSDTLFPVFSVTKILPILAVHLWAERGLLDYDTPVAEYWPEYGAHGKDRITLRHVLSHRAGVPNMPDDVTIDDVGDWDRVVGRLAELAPVWPTDTRSSYLSYTYGWLLGETVRRTDPLARTFRQIVLDELLAPLGVRDFHLGVPDDPAVTSRIATLSNPGFRPASDHAAPFRRLAVPAGLAPGPVFNDPRLRRAVFPSAGGIANARSAAAVMALLANHGTLNGVRLLAPGTVGGLLPLRADPYAVDEVIGKTAVMCWSGFRRGSDHPNREAVIGTSPRVLSQSGSGGSVAWADLDARFSAAICHNRMFRVDPAHPERNPFNPVGDAVRNLVEVMSRVPVR